MSSFESIEEMFRADTGGELLDYFSEFAEEPIGAASLAQVHLATVKNSGQRVAVKVQHPSPGAVGAARPGADQVQPSRR